MTVSKCMIIFAIDLFTHVSKAILAFLGTLFSREEKIEKVVGEEERGT